MNTKAIGEFSLFSLIATLGRSDRLLSIPLSGNQRYDLLSEEPDGTILKIQVKTGWITPDGANIRFQTCASSTHRRGGKKRPYQVEVDLFAVYLPELDKVYTVPVDEASDFECRWRLRPPRNKQGRKIC